MPTAPFTYDDLGEIMVDRLGLAPDEIPVDPDTAFTDVGLDSLAVVEIQSAIQQRYGFRIPDEDAGTMTTLRETVDYVNERLGAAEVL